jgi:hypothetical protein
VVEDNSKSLAWDDPGSWTITLTDGSELTVRADSFGREDGTYRFHLYLEGTPLRLFQVLTVPDHVVKDIKGG